LREDYAEILHLCRNCRCLFWKTYGHPCIVDHQQQTDKKSDEPSCDPEAFYVPVPPQAFLKFFSL
jgi:F-box protein 25/32